MRFRLVPGLVAAAALTAPDAHATVLVQLTTRQLTEQAELVVRGKVLSQQVAEQGGRLWTDSTVQVLEPLKGRLRAGQTLIVRQPGGERGRIGMRVAGVARFRPGEEVLLFASSAGDRQIPVGMCQGKFEIVRDRSGLRRAHRDLGGAGFVRFEPDGKMTLDHRPAPDPDLPLGKLLDQVRALAGRGARPVRGGR